MDKAMTHDVFGAWLPIDQITGTDGWVLVGGGTYMDSAATWPMDQAWEHRGWSEARHAPDCKWPDHPFAGLTADDGERTHVRYAPTHFFRVPALMKDQSND